jgi:hypothetical protein
MNLIKKFVTGLGNQTAPFGFAPEDPEAGYKAGLGYIGDIGANLLANNQGGVDPFANLGASMLQAKDSSTRRNKEQYTAQRLMEEAQLKRQEREQAETERKRREDYINTLPADVRMKTMSIPGYLDEWIAANDPDLQKPEKPKLYTVNGALVDENGNVVYEGGSGPLSEADRYKVVGNRLYDVLEGRFVEDGNTGQGDLPKGYRWKEDGTGAEPIPGVTVPGSPKPFVPQSSDRNAARAASEENALLEQTLVNLDEASSLVKDTNSGYLAAGRAAVAENLPDGVVPDRVFGSPKGGAATLRFKQIMDAEALASMGKLLKGPTSDRDVRIMLETVNDSNASVKRKQDSIDQVKRLIKAQVAANKDTIKFSLKGPDSGVFEDTEGYVVEPLEP